MIESFSQSSFRFGRLHQFYFWFWNFLFSSHKPKCKAPISKVLFIDLLHMNSRWSSLFATYLSAISRSGKTFNIVFATLLHWHHYNAFKAGQWTVNLLTTKTAVPVGLDKFQNGSPVNAAAPDCRTRIQANFFVARRKDPHFRLEIKSGQKYRNRFQLNKANSLKLKLFYD